MSRDFFRLRHQSVPVRIGLTCFILILAGGYAASLYHLEDHVAQKDGEPGLTMLDLEGTYHGVQRPAPLLAALDDERHREEWLSGMEAADVALLRDWLAKGDAVVSGGSDPVQSGYDTLPDGAPEETRLPADVIDDHCVRCHAPGAKEGGDIGRRISLERWPDVRKVAYSKRLDPVSVEILATSTHTHALSIPLFSLAACLLFLATAWPRMLRHGVFALMFVGLLLDLSGMWLARFHASLVWLVVAGGALYGLSLGIALFGSLADLWLGRPSGD